MKPVSRVLSVVLGAVLVAAVPSAALAARQVSATNSSRGTASATGPAIGANVSAFRTSPTAVAVVGASAQQRGSTRVAVKQQSNLKSGDVVAGSQVQGLVGDTDVMSSNSSTVALGLSGIVASANVALGGAGPVAISIVLEAQASQTGDNVVDVDQDLVAESGDAVVGSQVTGVVADEQASVTNQSNSVLGLGVSGVVLTLNTTPVPVFAGPIAVGLTVAGLTNLLSGARVSQAGNNAVAVNQANDADSGDGVSGAQITGVIGSGTVVDVMESNTAVGTIGVSGLVQANNNATANSGPLALSDVRTAAQQFGSNGSEVVQAVDALSGDAVGGAQVTGVVAGAGADISISNQQTAAFAAGITLAATSNNTATVLAGPAAIGQAAPESLFGQSSQFGSNAVALDQESAAATGNALAASQTTGAVGGDGSDIDVNVQNASGIPLAFGLSGGATAGSQVTGAVGGANSDIDVSAGNQAVLLGISLALAQASGAANAAQVAAGPLAVASISADASQFGDDTIDATQVTNDANTAVLNAGPAAIAGSAGAPPPLARASATQTGSDVVGLVQEADSASGDTLAGSQVTGATAGDGSDVDVQKTNNALIGLAISGDIPVTNNANVVAGPVALATPAATLLEFATAQQTGRAEVAVEQSIAAATGDAIAGAQVTGVAGADTADVSVSGSAALVLGISGTPTANNAAVGFLGPLALATITANASGAVETVADNGQSFTTESGDAVSGGQVTGRA